MQYVFLVCLILFHVSGIAADTKPEWPEKVNVTRSRIRTLSYSFNVFLGSGETLTGNSWIATKLSTELQPHFDPFVPKEDGKLLISRDAGANYAVDAWDNPIHIYKDGESTYFISHGSDGKPQEDLYDKTGKPLSRDQSVTTKPEEDLICLHTPETGSNMCDMIRYPSL